MREVPKLDADYLRRSLRLSVDANEPLPDEVTREYFQFKHFRDPLDGSPLRADECALICRLARMSAEIGDEDPDIEKVRLLNLCEPGDDLLVLWNKQEVFAKFSMLARVRQKVVVEFPDDPKPRELDLDKVLEVPVKV